MREDAHEHVLSAGSRPRTRDTRSRTRTGSAPGMYRWCVYVKTASHTCIIRIASGEKASSECRRMQLPPCESALEVERVLLEKRVRRVEQRVVGHVRVAELLLEAVASPAREQITLIRPL